MNSHLSFYLMETKHTQPWAPIVFLQSSPECHRLGAPEPDKHSSPKRHAWLQLSPQCYLAFLACCLCLLGKKTVSRKGHSILSKQGIFFLLNHEDSDIYVFFHTRHWVTFPDLGRFLLKNTSVIGSWFLTWHSAQALLRIIEYRDACMKAWNQERNTHTHTQKSV